MIQRKQTIWLLLAAITGFLITRVPLYAGTLAGETVRRFTATESLLLFAVAIVAALIGLIAVFLFKNRPLQMKLTVLGTIVSIGFIALEVWKIGEFEQSNALLKGSYYWGALLPIAMAVFLILAAIHIRKDEKLVKSLDRLR
jgi:FtsH-binding integral membrane protein